MFSLEQKKTLLALARSALTSHFEQHRLSLPSDEAFQPKRGVFVSLHMGDELRGCIGYIKGYKSIASSVVEMAEAAAFRDPRFVPLEKRELPSVNIEISVLGELLLLSPGAEPEVGKDGLFISHPYGSGLLLPQVAVEWKWDARTFLREVCRKAGLNSGAYKDADSKVYRFTADVFSEKDTF
ncbi:MAG: AmmeMemoRadiSam system protein A [Candidatus Cloacimonetes bacterium HGW-Cloacimonetes-3]|jgi:AmmeMemoRadiSam system protein A|nr:MAG: AmmeMemoRadiSam system protein A [Candidatus Cloacimonetes bacterium HGW-Cloacimonetes-3]